MLLGAFLMEANMRFLGALAFILKFCMDFGGKME